MGRISKGENLMDIIDIAKVAHEINKAYCEALGDASQPTWEEAPTWQKESAIKGVEFHLENPDVGPSEIHDAWSNLKIAEGWVYGSVKAPDLKQHPCLVPYLDLPLEQRVKDFLFRQVVHSLDGF